MQTALKTQAFKEGSVIAYNDGRPGHTDILATVLDIDSRGMTVQFDDRADTTRIEFSDHNWMEYLSPTLR